MGYVPRPLRRTVHVALPRNIATGRRRGYTLLSDAAVAQARQHQGTSLASKTISHFLMDRAIFPGTCSVSGMDRRGVSSVLLARARVRYAPGPVQLQQVRQQLLLGRHSHEFDKFPHEFSGRFRHIHHARVHGARPEQEHIRSGSRG